MRDQASLFVELLGIAVFEDLRDLGVKFAPPLAHETAKRRFHDQRMAEGKTRDREKFGFLDEFAALEARQRVAQFRDCQARDAFEDRLFEILTDNRCCLQNRLVLRRKPIDARRQHSLDRFGHAEIGDVPGKGIRSLFASQLAGFR